MPGNDLEYLEAPVDHGFSSSEQLLVTICEYLCLDVEQEDERDCKVGIEESLLFWVCFKRKIFALQITHLSGNVR